MPKQQENRPMSANKCDLKCVPNGSVTGGSSEYSPRKIGRNTKIRSPRPYTPAPSPTPPAEYYKTMHKNHQKPTSEQ